MFWDGLRTAFNLAQRVEEVESQLCELKSDWTDVEDKLLAREERLRKRMSRELKRELDNPVVPPSGSPPDLQISDDRSSTKKQIERQFRLSRGEK